MASKWRLSDIPGLKGMIEAMWITGDAPFSDEHLNRLNLTITEGKATVFTAVYKLEFKEKTILGSVLPMMGAAYPEIPEERRKDICTLAHSMIIDKSTVKKVKAWHKAYTIFRKKI